jgi:hypothetical protein
LLSLVSRKICSLEVEREEGAGRRRKEGGRGVERREGAKEGGGGERRK